MTRFSILTLALVASSTAFAVGRPAAAANPPAAGTTAAVKACVAVNPAGKGKDWGHGKCLDENGAETTHATFEGVSWHGDPQSGHWGCGATESDHVANAWDSLTGACEDAAKAKADSKIATRSWVTTQIGVDHDLTVAMSTALGMTETEVTDGTGVVTKVMVSKALADQQDFNTGVTGRLDGIDFVNTTQTTEITTANNNATAALEAAGKKVDKDAYEIDQKLVAGALVALGDRATAVEDRTAATEINVTTLWDGAHFVGHLAPAFVFLDGGTPITVDENSNMFAGEKVAFGQRGAIGVAGGFGGEWQWGGIMATGSIGVLGEYGNQVGTVGVVAYYPFHVSSAVQVDFGIEGSYLEAGDRQFNTTYSGSTSSLKGFGGGPSLAIGVGDGPTKLDIRGALLLGGVNQALPFVPNETGDMVLENQNATAFVFSVGGRFGSAPHGKVSADDVKSAREAKEAAEAKKKAEAAVSN